MKPKVLFRVDGSSEIGLGHIFRCLALADMLRNQFDCLFYTRTDIPSVLTSIENNYSLVKLGENHLDEFIEYPSREDIVVLDNYFFTSEYQQSIKETGAKLVCIDDTHDKEYHANLVINHGPGIVASDYSCAGDTKLLLGLDYLLLRDSFLINARDEHTIQKDGKLFVCFGGSDIRNITTTIALNLDSCKNVNHADIVIGGGFQHKTDLLKVLKSVSTSVTLHEAIDEEEMIQLLNNASAAIVPSSMMLLETLTAGIPVLTGMYIDNQKFIHDYFSKQNDGLKTIDFTSEIVTSAHMDELMNSATPKKKLVDGLSNYRLLNEFILLSKPELSWRKPTEADVDLYFDWANDEDVRKSSYQSAEINYDNHVNWFNRKIHDENTLMYLFSYNNQPCGQVRFELENSEATIGVSIAKEFRNKKLASHLLSIASNNAFLTGKVNTIKAYIKIENERSSKAFERAGYSNRVLVDVQGISSILLTKSLNK